MQLKIKDYVLEEELGQGAYGKVFKTSFNKQPLAIKACSLESSRGQNTFNREVRSLMYQRLRNSKRTVQCKESFLVGQIGYIVMEFMDHDLLQEIQKKETIQNEAKCARIFLEICEAVHELHYCGLAHMDLKPENILVSTDGRYVLGDLGSCCAADEPRKKKDGSRNYAAPEVVAQETYIPRKADIWSLGIIFHVLITGHFPDLCDQLRVALCDVQMLSTPCLSLISSMLSYDPAERPTLDAVMKNSWLKKTAAVPKPSFSSKTRKYISRACSNCLG